MNYLQDQSDGRWTLALYVQPRAGKNEVVGLHNNSLKIRLTSPPVDGKANKALLAFLAKLLRVSKSSLEIKSGHQGRHKKICVSGLQRDVILERLGQGGQPHGL